MDMLDVGFLFGWGGGGGVRTIIEWPFLAQCKGNGNRIGHGFTERSGIGADGNRRERFLHTKISARFGCTIDLPFLLPSHCVSRHRCYIRKLLSLP